MRSLVLLTILTAGAASAQTTTGTLLGNVKDPSGSVIPGAKIQVTDENTNIQVTVLTNAAGDYVAADLRASNYSVRAEAPRFRKATVTGIQLLLNATVRQDFRLETSVLEQEITVTADAPAVNSETSSITGVVDAHSAMDLPLDGRTLDSLVLLTAGNTSDSASNPRLAGSVYWGGNYYSVDGVAFNDTGNGGAAYSYSTKLTTTPSVDTVQEIKIESNNAKAENEGATAISMVTKGGANRLRFSIYEFHRDRADRQELLRAESTEAAVQSQRRRRDRLRPYRPQPDVLLPELRRVVVAHGPACEPQSRHCRHPLRRFRPDDD